MQKQLEVLQKMQDQKLQLEKEKERQKEEQEKMDLELKKEKAIKERDDLIKHQTQMLK